MRGRTPRLRMAAASMAMVLLLSLPLTGGCGGGGTAEDALTKVNETATAFLDALGNRDFETMRALMSQGYIETNGVPDPITEESFAAALGSVSSYRFAPEEDVSLAEGRAVITVELGIAGKGPREETLVLSLEEGAWKVDAFTAMDWSRRSAAEAKDKVQVEQALRDFLIACIDGDTAFIFDNLSPGYKERHRLDDAWTPAEFAGIFGTARSYDFDPAEIDIEGGTAGVNVTVEFGSRGNLESETSRVVLVKEGGKWLVDAFPFFIY